MTSTEELPVWTVVRDWTGEEGDGDALVFVVRAASRCEAGAVAQSQAAAQALEELGFNDPQDRYDAYDEEEEEEDSDHGDGAYSWVSDRTTHVLTLSGDVTALLDPTETVVRMA